MKIPLLFFFSAARDRFGMEEKDETCDPDRAGRWIQPHVPGAAYDYQQQLYQMRLGSRRHPGRRL